MHQYKIHYLADQDDGDPKFFTRASPLQVGEVIELPETSFFHVVVRFHSLKTCTRVDLSKSAQNPQEAIDLAKQMRHWPGRG